MSNQMINAQELLDRILKSGQALAKQAKTASGDLPSKAKDIAMRGEEYLADKLDIDDSAVSREALRKGVGAGAAAGALALLLSSRSGRKMTALGGLAGLGLIAWKAKNTGTGEMPRSVDEVIGLFKGETAEARADIILGAMVAAARADDRIDAAEQALIDAYNAKGIESARAVLNSPADPEAVAAMASSEQEAREIYAASCRVADGLNEKERVYLDRLAMALRLDPDMAARIETDIRTGRAPDSDAA